MTEAQWLTANDPAPMLDFLRGKATDRKLRLFAAACCRRIWDVLTDEAGRSAVHVAERFADGEATADDLRLAAEAVSTRHAELEEELEEREDWEDSPDEVRRYNAVEAAWLAVGGELGFGLGGICGNVDWARERDGTEYPALCDLLRDVFGTLAFRPTTADPALLTSAVTALARQMYDDRDFSPMPILADALEEAGCTDPEVLDHCRGPGPHVRGCWVVDSLLRKG
jgi:hypothetical protein